MVEPGANHTIVVILPPALLRLFPEAEQEASLPARTVAELLDALEARWPGMGARLRDETPAIRRHINIFVRGRRADLATALEPGETVTVLTAVSGG